MKREELIQQATDSSTTWDIIVVGGGATGLGVALDATTRGYKTLLLEQADFSKGTSSRSTKLVHGGVRYLAQGNVALVREALRERGLLQKNAPHLVRNLTFVIPNYQWWSGPYYTIGLKAYDILSGKLSLGSSKRISKKETLSRIPTIKPDHLYSGVTYQDGQFDDSRLAVNVAQTCLENGGTLLNYFKVTDLVKNDGKVAGVEAIDTETGHTHTFNGKSVVNATGVFVDDILQMDKPRHTPRVKPSQGVHIVLDKSFLPGDNAIMIPKTEDGRVLFAVPWHDKVVVGTTDTPLEEKSLEPRALDREIDFILRTAQKYLAKAPIKKDIKSVFAGLRPLAAPKEGSTKTKEISRGHKIWISDSGLLTITGGKWTTFRRMGEDTVNHAAKIAGLPERASVTEDLPIHGSSTTHDWDDPMYFYGSDKERVLALTEENSEWAEKLHEEKDYIKAEVIWAARHEMARTVEDFLARRIRELFLDVRSTIDMAPEVATLLAQELDKDEDWIEQQVKTFTELAQGYLLEPYHSETTHSISN